MNADLNHFITHLEFMGYEIEQLDEKRYKAMHEKYFNMIVKDYVFGVIFISIFGKSDTANRETLLEFANALNDEAILGRFIVDQDEDLRVEFVFSGDYSKKEFSRFIELIQSDFKAMASHEDAGALA